MQALLIKIYKNTSNINDYVSFNPESSITKEFLNSFVKSTDVHVGFKQRQANLIKDLHARKLSVGLKKEKVIALLNEAQ